MPSPGDPLEDVLGLVLAAGSEPLGWRPEPESLAPRMPDRCTAVDGSHGILVQAGGAWVVAVRAAAVTWPGAREDLPVAIHATLPRGAAATVAAAADALGLPAPRNVRSADAFAEAMRSLAEHEACLSAAGTIPPGSLLLVDGALTRLPPAQQEAADQVLRVADQRGVHVVGVSKRSALSVDGVPLAPRVLAVAREEGWQAPWAVSVPDKPGTWIAQLHAASPHAFRVDGPRGALDLLAGLSRDAAYIGYPYPLAVAHNAVVLTAGHLEREKGRLEAAVRSRGGAAAWAWLRDFHQVLDRNVP